MTETTGSIINIVNTGQTITLTVRYVVNHHVYALKEEAVLKPAKQLTSLIFVPNLLFCKEIEKCKI